MLLAILIIAPIMIFCTLVCYACIVVGARYEDEMDEAWERMSRGDDDWIGMWRGDDPFLSKEVRDALNSSEGYSTIKPGRE